METVIEFMRQLGAHNNKAWFDAHREDYEEMKRHLEELAEEFIAGVAQFDKRCKGLQVKDCTYRIYRDIRFSPDKTPYKHWCGVYVCPRGKRSGMAGYYFHVEPLTESYFLASGMYNPTKEVLQSVREQIMLEPEEFERSLRGCEDFVASWETALKRIPSGYAREDGKASEYLRLRDYSIVKKLTEADMLSSDFMKNALENLKRTLPFNELLNRCHEYAYEG